MMIAMSNRMRIGLRIVLILLLVAAFEVNAQVNRGYTGTQVFQNCGEPDPELTLCNVLANSGVFLVYVPPESGILHLNTDGSTFDTVMGVFTNPISPRLVACNNNGGIDGQDSALTVPVRGGQSNIILVAGVNGECGTVEFAYSLVTTSRLATLPRTQLGQFQGRVIGHTNMRFTIQASTNLSNWTALFTTNSTNANLDFLDRTAPIPPKRFYRAMMLP